MNDAPDNSRPGYGSSAMVAIVVLLPLLYALSIGPTAYCLAKFRPGRAIEDVAGAFYDPIIWITDHTPMQDPLVRYIVWWEQLAQRK